MEQSYSAVGTVGSDRINNISKPVFSTFQKGDAQLFVGVETKPAQETNHPKTHGELNVTSQLLLQLRKQYTSRGFNIFYLRNVSWQCKA